MPSGDARQWPIWELVAANLPILLFITLGWVVLGPDRVEVLAALNAPVFLNWWILRGNRRDFHEGLADIWLGSM